MAGFRTIIIGSPCRLSYKSGYMVVRKEDETVKLHLSEVASVTVETMQVYVSAYLLAEFAKNKISFVVCDGKHNPVGQYLPLYGAHNTSKRITEQLSWGEPIKKRVWQRVVREKIRQQAALLADRDLPEAKVLKSAIEEVRSGDSTHREAAAARVYFQSLFGLEFTRDINCVVNDALDYGYSILLSMVNREIAARGYLTQCGICHRNEYNEFNLACDLMEPFRPVVDRAVDEWVAGEFDSAARRMLADLPNKVVLYKDGNYKLASVISLYVQDCLNALNKKAAVDEIAGFDVV